MIDSDPLTRSYITRTRGLSLPFVHRPCDPPLFPSVGPLESSASPPPTQAGARARRLSGVRSTNKSNMPRFVPRESSSFTIHEFIMGTTENTAGPPLLIYRYAYPASRTGPIFTSNVDARSWGEVRSQFTNTPNSLVCVDARKLTPDAARCLHSYFLRDIYRLYSKFFYIHNYLFVIFCLYV